MRNNMKKIMCKMCANKNSCLFRIGAAEYVIDRDVIKICKCN